MSANDVGWPENQKGLQFLGRIVHGTDTRWLKSV